ncbi:FMN-binding protein [Rhizocola hellebori]|uniref:FMN-binding protein n=1 Tax=Rhizocola hellebori TaxID=1392758 RepID=A0A8J3QE96_9ACTN|nr:FMN-binding protein [Rhizocola hellebori]GIH07716.1 FMN-binding protein [Rhizocola hellebori]
MRRITLWLVSTIAGLVLLFSYRTSTMGADTATGSTVTTDGNLSGGSNAEDAGGSGGIGGSGGAKTYKGSVAGTRWGDVQVAITVANGKITDVSVPVYPTANGRDRQINAYALPILKQETLAAQSADIDTVSGATVTSDGYVESLQAALDAAHLS